MGSSVKLEDVARKIPPQDMHFQRQTVADLLGRMSTGFPGAQPVSFARKHFMELQRTDYYLCEKTDGIRCLLYLTSFVEPGHELEAQFLIDRKNDYWHIPTNYLHLPLQGNIAEYHRATILDGELVRQTDGQGNSRLMYLIFDCLCLDGSNIMARNLDIRLGKVKAFVYDPWKAFTRMYPQDVEAQPFQLEFKKMELPYGVDMMFRQVLPNLPHGNDGLIFTCKTTPYVTGTDHNILKWKPPHENTIDFRLQIGEFPKLVDDEGEYEDWDAKPYFDLLVNHGGGEGGYQKYAELGLLDTEWEAMKLLNEPFDHRIIECWKDPDYPQRGQWELWRPKLEPNNTPRFRDDKREANYISTVRSVIDSIEDAVTEEELIRRQGEIRTGWKRREAEAKQRRDEVKRKEAEHAKRRQIEAAQRQQRQQPVQQPPPPLQQQVKVEVDEDDGPKYTDD